MDRDGAHGSRVSGTRVRAPADGAFAGVARDARRGVDQARRHRHGASAVCQARVCGRMSGRAVGPPACGSRCGSGPACGGHRGIARDGPRCVRRRPGRAAAHAGPGETAAVAGEGYAMGRKGSKAAYFGPCVAQSLRGGAGAAGLVRVAACRRNRLLGHPAGESRRRRNWRGRPALRRCAAWCGWRCRGGAAPRNSLATKGRSSPSPDSSTDSVRWEDSEEAVLLEAQTARVVTRRAYGHSGRAERDARFIFRRR